MKSPIDLLVQCKSILSSLGEKCKNKILFCNDDFIVMVVVGPNQRTDFHINNKQVIKLIKIPEKHLNQI